MITDRQKAEKIASHIISMDEPITYSTLIDAMMKMAEWKDREVLREHQRKVRELTNKLLS